MSVIHLSVLQLKILVGKLLAIDRSAAGSVPVREVAALDHEVRDDAVEGRALGKIMTIERTVTYSLGDDQMNNH